MADLRLEKVIAPIVRGQIKSFMLAHPEALLRPDLAPSIAKRIINDLTCDSTVARLRAALWNTTEGSLGVGVGYGCVCGGRDGANLSRPEPLTPLREG